MIDTEYEGFFAPLVKAMRLNLVWYIPIFGIAILVFSGTAAVNFYRDIKYLYKFWTWQLMLSPSAYLWFISAWAEILLPPRLAKMVPHFFTEEKDGENSVYKKRFLWSFLMLAGIVITYYLLEIIIWGSYPLFTDAEHYVRLRIFPFLPWPNRPFPK